MTAEADDPTAAETLEKFRLYETRARFYLIGTSREKRWFQVLKIDRSERSELNISEDPVWYSQQEVKNLLQRISEGNRSTGGLTFVTKAYGIAGCIKFLESYYLILVTKRRQIGCICGHPIYCIDESQMITIPHSFVQTDVATSKNELRYKKLLASVDLTKDFFYSYTYPIMRSLQQNVTSAGMKEMPYENLFVWNTFLTEPIRSRCRNTLWTVALVHGHFKQVIMSNKQSTIFLISGVYLLQNRQLILFRALGTPLTIPRMSLLQNAWELGFICRVILVIMWIRDTKYLLHIYQSRLHSK